jgi:protein-tyrosine phosphatase
MLARNCDTCKMIDLHSHILFGVDDGAPDLEASLAMARMAVADGIEVMAATPHFLPGLYDNNTADVLQRIDVLNEALLAHDINLAVVSGGDVHISPDLHSKLQSNQVLTLHGTRYFLFEPPHITAPQHLENHLFNIQVAGYVPILTHPERLKWIEQKYDLMQALAKSGVWMQITAGSLTGRFGKRPQYWAQRMMAEGLVHILATDAHNTRSRPPLLAEAFECAKRELGAEEAQNLVLTRPKMILENAPPETMPQFSLATVHTSDDTPLWRRLLGLKN